MNLTRGAAPIFYEMYEDEISLMLMVSKYTTVKKSWRILPKFLIYYEIMSTKLLISLYHVWNFITVGAYTALKYFSILLLSVVWHSGNWTCVLLIRIQRKLMREGEVSFFLLIIAYFKSCMQEKHWSFCWWISSMDIWPWTTAKMFDDFEKSGEYLSVGISKCTHVTLALNNFWRCVCIFCQTILKVGNLCWMNKPAYCTYLSHVVFFFRDQCMPHHLTMVLEILLKMTSLWTFSKF